CGMFAIFCAVYMNGYFRTEVYSRLIRGSVGFVALWGCTVLGLRSILAAPPVWKVLTVFTLITGLFFTSWNIQQKLGLKINSYTSYFIRSAQSQVPLFKVIGSLNYNFDQLVVQEGFERADGANRIEDGV